MLAGTICCQDGQPKTFDHCLCEARAGRCQHSLPLISAMQKNTQRRQGIGISSSVLGVCPRQHILAERNDYYESPQDYYNRWRGSFGHYAIEMGGPYPGVIQEQRFYRRITADGVEFEVSGQPDWFDDERGHLSDSKFVGYAPKEPREDHVRQVNVYAWLLEGGYFYRTPYAAGLKMGTPTDYSVHSADILYMDTHGEHRFDVPLWTTDAVEQYIRRRLAPHAAYAKSGNLGGIGITEKADEWKAKYCPFVHACNPGRCCMAPDTE